MELDKKIQKEQSDEKYKKLKKKYTTLILEHRKLLN